MNVSKVRVIERDVIENFDVLRGAMIYHYLKDELANLTLNDNKLEILLEIGVEILDSWSKAKPKLVAEKILEFLHQRIEEDNELTYGRSLSQMTNYDYEVLFEETLFLIEEKIAEKLVLKGVNL
jgi:isopentenyl diphosphate isomerase/L-lactate dehydrogenase-like FMN-dependent dehydrogenase